MHFQLFKYYYQTPLFKSPLIKFMYILVCLVLDIANVIFIDNYGVL